MSDDALHINVVGGSQAEGELKKVAGGYRAIGKAAEQAAHSADKVHGGGHERKRAQTFSRAFLGGRGGAGGALGHLGHLGVAGGAAYVAMEGAVQLAEILKRSSEEALENLKFQREITRDIAEISTKRNEMALRAAEGMSTFDKGREAHEHSALGVVLAQAEAFERMKMAEEKATRAGDASAALGAEKSAYANPALNAVMKKLQPKKDELDDLGFEAQHESKIGRFMANFEALTHLEFSKVGHAGAQEKYADAAVKFNEQSGEAIDKAMESDKARRETVEAAMKLNEAAGALHGAVTRTQSAIPGN
jgi:hypothetical protein